MSAPFEAAPHGPLGSPLEEALRYAAHGLPICPCTAKKSPRVGGGFKAATCDPAQISTWWTSWPEALIGMPTGARSGILVLDLDVDKTGAPVGEDLALEMGLFDEGDPGASTPSGGRHVYFRHVPGIRNSAGKLGAHIDVRGEGGYVCVPGAGGYQRNGPPPWVPTGLRDAGPTLSAALRPAPKQGNLGDQPDGPISAPRYDPPSLQRWAAEVASAPEGGRNDALNRAAFALGREVAAGALQREDVEQALTEAALQRGLGQPEIARTIASGLAGGMTRPGNLGAAFSTGLPRIGRLQPNLSAAPDLLLRPTPAPAPYPVEALGPLHAAALAAQDVTQAPIALCGQSALAIASLATQGLADVELLSGAAAPLSLFLLSIAESGERKSSVDKRLIRGVREHERRRHQATADAMRRSNDRSMVWQERRKAILARARHDDADVDVDLAALGQEPEAPLLPNILLPDPTLEGITKHLGVLRASLGLFSDEGGAFLGGTAMSKDNKLKTMAGLSGMWDGGPVNRTRAGDGISTYHGRRLCCHLMVQPIAAEALLGDPMAMEQGFLARFLICAPQSLIGSRLRRGHAHASDVALDDWAQRVEALLDRPLPLAEGARNELAPPMLRLSPQARALLHEFQDDLERGQAKGEALEAIRPFASKAAEQAARIAGVLTLFAEPEAAWIGLDAMAGAIRLAEHHVNEALRLAGAATITERTRDADLLREWLALKWEEPFISASDVARSGPGRLREALRAREALQFLAGFGHLELMPGGAEIQGKRRREAWRVIRDRG